MPTPEPRRASPERSAAPLFLQPSAPQSSANALAVNPLEIVAGTGANPVRVLLVEADAACRTQFAANLRGEGYEVAAVKTGAEALALLRRSPFDLALLDSDLPDLRGLDLLRVALKYSPQTPFVLLAWRANVEMARAALTLGAGDFVTRPFPLTDLPVIAERNLTVQSAQRRNSARRPIDLLPSQESALDTLLTALKGRGTEPPGHSERVTAYTIETADRMGLPAQERYGIERGALLHDIGKIGIPDRILLKSGPLTPEEWTEVRKHPVIGWQMCAPIPLLADASLVVRHHHERWDGSGYPDGLSGAEIPPGARIFAFADAFDAMTSERPYRKTVSMAEARAEIERGVGSRYDPEIAAIFLNILPARLEQIRLLAGRP